MKKIKLGDIGSVRMCKRTLKEETNSEGGIPFYKISTFGNVADVFIDKDKYENYKTRFSYPKKGEVLISAAGTIGRTVIYNGEDAYFQDSNIVWIENEEKEVLNSFLYYAYQNVRWKTSNGSTILRLYNDDLRLAHYLKEWFYEICQSERYSYQRAAFWNWVKAAEKSGIPVFEKCAKTFRNW